MTSKHNQYVLKLTHVEVIVICIISNRGRKSVVRPYGRQTITTSKLMIRSKENNGSYHEESVIRVQNPREEEES